MPTDTPGIHHVTGIVGDAQEAVDFYAGVLGLRFVKQTVNFEDVLQHHLYFGDDAGRPGTVFTGFADPHGTEGRVGKPQVAAVAFAVPDDSLEYWQRRLAEYDVPVDGPRQRFDDRVLEFRDPVGTRVELVTGTQAGEPRRDGPVPVDVAVRGVHGVSLLSVNPYSTAGMLETLGFEYVRETDERVRYRSAGDLATDVDVLDREATFGREGQGTLHHVAMRVDTEDDLHEWRELFDEREYDVSRVKDRHFFHSLYVREPGGILFELATETDGLVGDDPDPGGSLYLPEWFEPDRDLVESQLPELRRPNERRPEGIGPDENGPGENGPGERRP